MQLFTPAEIPPQNPTLSYADHAMLFGSCFADEMGRRLTAAKFDCDVNPYGTLYNPFSISKAIRQIIQGHEYTADDLIEYRGLWHSMMHHSDFSAPTCEETLHLINDRLHRAHEHMGHLSLLMLTFGSAYVYWLKDDATDIDTRGTVCGTVVGNCHKMPERDFGRRRLSQTEIVADYSSLMQQMFSMLPELKVLITVSPIRHVRDGMHANQLSKATLLLAADELMQIFPSKIFYFPAYEIMSDELRDYRFYADDLVHPSSLAADYVWEKFCTYCMSKETRNIMRSVNEIKKMMEHRPIHPESEEYRSFLCQIMLKAESLCQKYPYFDFTKEIEKCRTQLSILPK